MNLKDRMQPESLCQEKIKISKENEKNTDTNNTLSSLNPSAPETIMKKQSETIQMLSSQVSELKSATADLRAELLSVQNLNQLLSTNNQRLSKENDDLRNNAGIESRKELQRLKEKWRAIEADNEKLRDQVDMSSVRAVEDARYARWTTESWAKRRISECEEDAENRICKAKEKTKQAISCAKGQVAAAKRKQAVAWSSLLFTLLCCLIRNRSFVIDVKTFFLYPIRWARNKIPVYFTWLIKPYHTKYIDHKEQMIYFSNRAAWFLRITTVLAILAVVIFMIVFITEVCRYYRKRWCLLSLRVVIATQASLLVFGDAFREHVPINLVLLFFMIQILYLIVLVCLDCHYECEHKLDKWFEIQNS